MKYKGPSSGRRVKDPDVVKFRSQRRAEAAVIEQMSRLGLNPKASDTHTARCKELREFCERDLPYIKKDGSTGWKRNWAVPVCGRAV